ncbi:hypothetical protein NQ318_020217 [Aromia moschata]|uniref:Uncharacterized protein n=1 Tax=Aromia moschata TaxID=1265417 RepID=A0AAV8ZCP9_9CUCU|nr:hypothetical protein NQ318_020217 [Aromia moschata]
MRRLKDRVLHSVHWLVSCVSGTYKLKKNDLQRGGVRSVEDSATGFYEKVTPEIYARINDGGIRV